MAALCFPAGSPEELPQGTQAEVAAGLTAQPRTCSTRWKLWAHRAPQPPSHPRLSATRGSAQRPPRAAARAGPSRGTSCTSRKGTGHSLGDGVAADPAQLDSASPAQALTGTLARSSPEAE